MSDSDFDEVFDFLTVGSGGGSMVSALLMRSQGKSVVILEKASKIGGTTARSGGVMWIPANRFMKADGVDDSEEQACQYMEATAGQSVAAPGTTLAKRRAYVAQGTRMIDFLVESGIRLRRVPSWPDYYDERAGGSVAGRTVIAELFDVNELGDWREKLEPNFMPLPVYAFEGFQIALAKSSWKGKLAMMKVGLRIALARITGKRWVGAGGALQGRMLQASLAAGVDIRTGSAVSSFITDDSGRVRGVVVPTNGRPWRVGARLGVLVNAGGFSQNQAMRDRYQPGTSSKWTAATAGNTGEMIEAMIGLGAAIGQMDEMVGNQMAIPPGRENSGAGVALGGVGGQMNIAKPHSIVVDRTGERYMNEAGSYMEFCQNMLQRNKIAPAVPSWWIVDQQYMDRYMYVGTMAGTQKPREWYENGFLARADNVSDLAAQIGVDPKALEATIDLFNADAGKGKDSKFSRGARAYDNWLGDHYRPNSQTLGPIEKAPYYAVPVVPGDVGTYGGVVTDENARVLRDDGSVIAGLYATGISTASVMGRIYPGAGSSLGPSFVFGYIAAKHAAQMDNLG